jgi:hypothetical protein
MDKWLTMKERIIIFICMFAIKILNPYGYSDEIKELYKNIIDETKSK